MANGLENVNSHLSVDIVVRESVPRRHFYGGGSPEDGLQDQFPDHPGQSA